MYFDKAFLAFVVGSLFFMKVGFAGDMGHDHAMTGVYTKAHQGLQVMLHLNPPHPIAEADTKALIMLADEKTGKPVTGLTLNVKWAMPAMGHDIAAQKVKEGDDGNYHASAKLPMGGNYAVVVSTEYQGRTVSLTFPFHAKDK